MNNDFVLLYNDDHLFLRDDVAAGIVIDENARFSVVSKKPYCRLKVYCMSKEQALLEFQKDYLDLLKEIERSLQEEKRYEIK